MTRDPNSKTRIREDVKVNVEFPALTDIAFAHLPEEIYIGTSFPIGINASDESNMTRTDVPFTLQSEPSGLARIDMNNYLYAEQTGTFTLTAEAEGIQHSPKSVHYP